MSVKRESMVPFIFSASRSARCATLISCSDTWVAVGGGWGKGGRERVTLGDGDP